MIHGIGIDVVEIARFGAALGRWGERIEGRLFTEAERAYARTQKCPERHFAARFAAKVSLHKALGSFVPYKDIEVVRSENGAPRFKVSKGVNGIALSLAISHDGDLAIAETIAERLSE